jgi:malate permease and related proteins
MLQSLIGALTPVFLLITLGIILSKKTHWLDNPSLGTMVSSIGVPALLLNSVLSMNMDVLGMGKLVGTTVLILALVALLSWGFLRLLGHSPRFYLPPLVNPNTGNLGIPVCYALFGNEGLAAAVVISSVVQVSHFTLGVGCMSGSFAPRQILKNGPVIALVVGAIFLALHLQMPAPIMKTVHMLGGITLPIMLMLLGHSLAQLTITDKATLSRTLLFSAWRPLAGVLVAFVVTRFMPLTHTEMLTMLVQQAMPMAVISYMLTVRYKGPADEVAMMILLSMPMSFIVAAAVWWLGA